MLARARPAPSRFALRNSAPIPLAPEACSAGRYFGCGRVRLALLAFLGLLLGACGTQEPRWVVLASQAAQRIAPRAEASSDMGVRWLHPQDDEEWIEVDIQRAQWSPMERPGRWRLTPPLRSLGRGLSSTARLTSDTREFEQIRIDKGLEQAIKPGTFALVGTWLVLLLAEDEAPPEHARLAERVQRRSSEHGRARIDGRRFSGDGFSVWPGERVELTLDIPAASALNLATVVEPLLGDEAERRYRFRVLLDGGVLLEHEQDEPHDGSLVRHTLVLPPEGRTGARLRLEVDGPLGATAFLEPVLVPTTRTEAPKRPDVVLFVADTFRADNLTAYGSKLGLTPNLDALAADSLLFASARSVGTYTLPAHATLFSGLYPNRVSADAFEKSLPEEVDTIAERFAAAGYRTGAVTGAVIVSRNFGMSQGFACFDELRGGMDSTMERVESFLAASDGRPTFLLVHTYRAHTPYESSAAARAAVEQATGRRIEGDFVRMGAEIDALVKQDELSSERAHEIATSLELLYRAGVADFDGEFARFAAQPRVRSLLERGYLVFTADHGEAFLEHGEIYHAGRVYEEQLDIPLFLRGPGLARGVRSDPASLVDLAPTLADLAGLPASTLWQGRSLRNGGERAFLYAFECREDREATLAVMAGSRKLIGRVDQRQKMLLPPLAAHDLATDPREQLDLLPAGVAWPEELQAHLEKQRAELIEPLIGPAPAQIDQEQLEDMRDLGYAR